MHYRVTAAYKPGVPLTTAQRKSGLFAFEPTLLGKTFRRGAPPMVLTEAQFKHNEHTLRRYEKAGAIRIERVSNTVAPTEPSEEKGSPTPAADAATMSTAGDTAATVPATTAAPDAGSAPSSSEAPAEVPAEVQAAPVSVEPTPEAPPAAVVTPVEPVVEAAPVPVHTPHRKRR